jgi:hypothetical protein
MPLAFPGSSRRKSDEPYDPYELVFRDGKRTVPPHLAEMMAGIDTVRYTYSEAIDRVNNRLVADLANAQIDRIISSHTREAGG